MTRYIFDIETDNLDFDKVTTIHCVSYTQVDTLNVKTITNYEEIKRFLLSAEELIGHNIRLYDIPLLERFLNIKIKAKITDTLPMSWYTFHARQRHGLEWWGEDFGIPKPKITDWSSLTPAEYAHRCEEDVKINFKLYHHIIKKLNKIYTTKEDIDRLLGYLSFKMKCIALQEKLQWDVDLDYVDKSISELEAEQAIKLDILKDAMPPVSKYKEVSKPAKMLKKDGTLTVHGENWLTTLAYEGLPSDTEGPIKIVDKLEEANPNSPEQVKDWLFSLGWKPKTFKFVKSDKGERKIPQIRGYDKLLCPSVLKLEAKEPTIKHLDGLAVIQHRLGILRSFKELAVDGKLTASVKGLTNTLRFKHANPLVNLPGIDKPYGENIRGALIAPDGMLLCGSDMVSLEDTTKKHYIFPYDPQYVKDMSVAGFDSHLDLALKSGAITQEEFDTYTSSNDKLFAIRKKYKFVNYAAVYGIGPSKLARELEVSVAEAEKLLDGYWNRNWSVKKFAAEQKIKEVDGEYWVYNPVSRFWYNLRSRKDVFSTLNQSTGAYLFDRWVAHWIDDCPLVVGQFHDEVILRIKATQKEEVEETLKAAIVALNKELKLNVELGIDIKFGSTYSSIH